MKLKKSRHKKAAAAIESALGASTIACPANRDIQEGKGQWETRGKHSGR